MKVSRSWISEQSTKVKSGFVKSLLVIFSLFYLPSCEFFETKVDEFLFQFNASEGTMNQVIVNGTLFIDGVTTDISTTNIFDLSVSDKDIFITLEIGNDIYFLAVPSVEKTYDLFDEYEGEVMAFTGGGYRTIGGIGNLSNFTVNATDTYEGEGSFSVSGAGEIQSTGGGSIKDLALQMDFDFNTSRGGGVSGGGSSSGGSGSGSGGSGGGSTVSFCTTTYQGPTGAPQRDGYCQAAWQFICKNGFSPDSKEVKAYCALYAQVNQITTPMQNCPYCR
ncbi:hypothetical protein [Algoriphagus litoralis]|uniref:hypothetical protein n=1 Tax=Algoriphagus litoralis TaxID=2202829 RepID=UPI0018E54DB7|nr:hypothetical protein [Algoriphagus litoralis]